MAGQSGTGAEAARGLGTRVKRPGQREWRESWAGGGSCSPAPQPHSPSGPSLAGARRRPRVASSPACWASRRAQAPLATTHGYATRVLSRQRRHRLPRAARAPSGRTEGLEGAIWARGRRARGISEIVGGPHLTCARAVPSVRWGSAAGTLGAVVRKLNPRKGSFQDSPYRAWFHPTRLGFLWPCLNSLF